MQRKASRLKAMMIAFLSISLAIILCASFHFDKIQQHEKYQNQLHFRELNNITVSLENSISEIALDTLENAVLDAVRSLNISVAIIDVAKYVMEQEHLDRERKYDAPD